MSKDGMKDKISMALKDPISWNNYGTELVMLKDFSGGFCTEFLQRVNV